MIDGQAISRALRAAGRRDLIERAVDNVPHDRSFSDEPDTSRPDVRLRALKRRIMDEFPGITDARAMEIAKERDPGLWRAYAQS